MLGRFDPHLRGGRSNRSMATRGDVPPRLFGAGRSAARSWVPPVRGYEGPKNVMITAGAKTYDVLAYDPVGAREPS